MQSLKQIVIVGAGQAAVQAIDTLRRKGFTGDLTVVGEEPWLPYQRPPLSKHYLAGSLASERLTLRPLQYYAERAVETRLGRRIGEISRRDQRLLLDDGSVLPYDALLLATGSRPRRLQVPGAELHGIHYLRTLDDVNRIRMALGAGTRIVIVGGGYIGLEVAATACELGLEVTVLEMADRLMSRVTHPEVSACYEAAHRRRGVRIICNTTVTALAEDHGRVRAVLTEDGVEHRADIVIVGVGVLPRDELAVSAGLECSNGIVVDEHCRTSDPLIYAAGDCTNHPNPHYGCRLRLESVEHAFEQGASAALNLLGTASVYDKVPSFWSDQYDLKLNIVGISHGHDTAIVRGIPSSGSFSVCYLRQGTLIAVDGVNSLKDQLAARKLIAQHATPILARLLDPFTSLKDTA